MRGTISRIDPLKYSRNGGSYIRIHFRLDGGVWAKTDIVPGYRNYERWKDLMVIGLDIDGLELKTKGEINADSYPEKFKPRPKDDDLEWKQMPDGTMALVKKPIIKKVETLPALDPELIQSKLL